MGGTVQTERCRWSGDTLCRWNGKVAHEELSRWWLLQIESLREGATGEELQRHMETCLYLRRLLESELWKVQGGIP